MTDPADNGGLFAGRRSSRAPVRLRRVPRRGSALRQRADGGLANVLLATLTLTSLLCWGPIPLAALWLGSQADYQTGSITVGILASFLTLFLLLFGALVLLRRIDDAWLLVRRAAGHEQRTGALGPVFGLTAAIGAIAFAVWFLVIHGPGVTA